MCAPSTAPSMPKANAAEVIRAHCGSVLALNRRRSGKPPSVSFKIPHAVLALPIRLIDRLRIDERTSRTSPLVVRIDIIHIHEETRIRHISGQRGIESMFRGHAM